MQIQEDGFFISVTAGLAGPPADANTISDQGFVKVFASKTYCITKNDCSNSELIPAAQRVLLEDPLSEFAYPQASTAKEQRALELHFILPGRQLKEPDPDEGRAAF